MNKDLKRRLYALALTGLIMSGVKTHAFAESIDDVDMEPIDIEQAIIELVPQGDNNSGNDNNNDDNNDNSNDDNLKFETKHEKHRYNSEADDVINQKAPTCEKGGSYDEIYYCIDCGEAHTVHVDVAAPGHNWVDSNEKINETPDGYDVIQYCSNKGCHEEHTTHVEITPPSEPPVTPPSEPPVTPPSEPPLTPPTYTGDTPKTADESLIAESICSLIASGAGLAGVSYLLYKDNQKKNYKAKHLKRK